MNTNVCMSALAPRMLEERWGCQRLSSGRGVAYTREQNGVAVGATRESDVAAGCCNDVLHTRGLIMLFFLSEGVHPARPATPHSPAFCNMRVLGRRRNKAQ